VAAAARARPDHPAVEVADARLTYAELDGGARDCARHLTALGVGDGGRVATTLPPSLDFAVLLHGAARLGAALVPLNTRLPPAEQRRQATLARVDAVVDGPLNGFEANVEERRELAPDAVHCVLFTSGTTGEPKPVPLTVANQEAAAAASASALGIDAGDRWLCPLPLFHIAGLAILVRCARAATTAVLHERFDPVRVREALEDHDITLVSLVPAQLQRLRDAGLEAAPALRAMLLGGGPVPPDLLEWAAGVGLPARCTYGMTETASQVVVTDVGETSGTPLPGVAVEIAPDGEILLRGDMVAPTALAADGWLHTGDLGRLDRHGRLHVDGRLDDLIVTGGEKVAPAAVEAVLLAHPAVAEAAVAGTPDEEWGEAVTAFVVERRPVADYDLLTFCREYLAGYQVPKRVVRLDSLPRNAGGKLKRRALSG
jgi:O-succinylbenzoic acid--CoA ligase